MPDMTLNPWKLTTIGLLLVGATALVTTFVVGQKSDTVSPNAPAKSQKKNTAIEHHRNTQMDIDTCMHAGVQGYVTGKYCRWNTFQGPRLFTLSML